MDHEEYWWNCKVEPIEKAKPEYAARRKQLPLPERKKDIAERPEEKTIERHEGNELEDIERGVGVSDQERDLRERVRDGKAVMGKQSQRWCMEQDRDEGMQGGSQVQQSDYPGEVENNCR